jgi:hypothetical protein
MKSLKNEIRNLINKSSRENESDTPDFILAEFLNSCLLAFESAVINRDGCKKSK